MKVYLSPSNQPNNKCVLGHSEKQHCEELVQRMLPLLQQRGIEYKVRNPSNSLSASVKEATAWGADLYVPIHTNATSSGTARGTRFGYYPGRTDSMKACKVFKKNWLKIYPLPDKVFVCTYNFSEAKNPKCPVVYCETVFHSNRADAEWFHANMNKVALNFVESISELLGVFGVRIQVQLTKQENLDYYGLAAGATVTLNMEDYIKAVVPSEMNGPLEACKAQSIASRSMAYYWLESGAHINDTTAFQSFRAPRGVNTAYVNEHQGVKDTEGQVLMYQGKVARAYFAHSNGGKMIASDEYWSLNTPYEQRTHLPYLVTKNDPWTLASGEPFAGHPIGMSQAGAIYAANQGKTCKEILAFYYPGTLLNNESEVIEMPMTGLARVETQKNEGLSVWSTITKDKRLIRVAKNETIKVVKDHGNGWVTAEYKGVVGFVDKQYLVLIAPLPVEPPVDPPETPPFDKEAVLMGLAAIQQGIDAILEAVK
ncbi:MAG: SpoIID/LytB domain-containing protein [Candidatus Sumerlaeales bacterium]|nr:SpoIID/LytB domain-containing protein [Candidatus Sumerlaeales bacterium]